MAVATLTVKERAELTGVGTSTIYLELEHTGQVLGVKALKIRQRWVIPKAPVEAALGIPSDGSDG